MPITWTYITPPASEPLTLEETKLHLREDGSEQDSRITDLIQSAREMFEAQTGRFLMPCVIREKFDCFPATGYRIRLRGCPVRSVTSISYVDSSGNSQTLATTDYAVDTDSEPARIGEAYGVVWPATRVGYMNAVTVDYAVGYASAAAVPQSIKSCLLMLVGHGYEFREAGSELTIKEVPMAVQSFLDRWALYTRS